MKWYKSTGICLSFFSPHLTRTRVTRNKTRNNGRTIVEGHERDITISCYSSVFRTEGPNVTSFDCFGSYPALQMMASGTSSDYDGKLVEYTTTFSTILVLESFRLFPSVGPAKR